MKKREGIITVKYIYLYPFTPNKFISYKRQSFAQRLDEEC